MEGELKEIFVKLKEMGIPQKEMEGELKEIASKAKEIGSPKYNDIN
jgi:hypothetical protein